ncbi:MAG TPA: efflux RND transporter permease subunit, partial [Acidobacteriaceae bacterium]
MSLSPILLHKSATTILLLVAVTLIAVLVGLHLPTGFIPQEDLGYLYAALQLPDASSLQRTDAAANSLLDHLVDHVQQLRQHRFRSTEDCQGFPHCFSPSERAVGISILFT